MSLLNNPPNSEPVVDQDSLMIRTSWSNFVMQLFRAAYAEYQSGTTAERPTTQLWPGRSYFDTSLGANGKKIFVNKTASGWVDGTGASV